MLHALTVIILLVSAYCVISFIKGTKKILQDNQITKAEASEMINKEATKLFIAGFLLGGQAWPLIMKYL